MNECLICIYCIYIQLFCGGRDGTEHANASDSQNHFSLQTSDKFQSTIVISKNEAVRKRREWLVPAWPLKENEDYTQKKFIAKIRSDYDTDMDITYALEGVGATQYPFNVFVVDPKTGLIRVTQVLDREVIDTYNLVATARFNDGTDAEKRIPVKIKVLDENDNAPRFEDVEPVDVYERSPAGTPVTRVTATDADEAGTVNSQLHYTMVKQTPPHDVFRMNGDGNIYVDQSTLDRERADRYFLTVKAQDLNGDPDGLTGTTTLTINVLDVNDNLLTLEKDMYEGSIVENTQGVEVMRIKAQDLDLEDTENWESVFDIVQGNEAKYFSIKTDPKTNQGVLMLDKPVDYEDVKDLVLGLNVRNKAPLHEGLEDGSTYKTYPVKINVQNQREGPYFDPKVKVIAMSEGGDTVRVNDVIERYPALDGDTGKPAEKVKYLKSSDPDNWLTIDPETADIKLNKMPDRESPFLVNGTYYTKILCVSEEDPSTTATGTVAIQVEDFNDHYPTLSNAMQTLCVPDDAVIVTAIDQDDFPNGAPFTFEVLPEGTQEKWKVERLNDTAAILRAQNTLWPGFHQVELIVRDQQGEASPEPQKMTVRVCTCEDGAICPGKKTELGPAGIGLLLLGLLLLLLVPLLLLFCRCGGHAGLSSGATDFPFETKSHLVNYCTEGQGENAEVPLTLVPTQIAVTDVSQQANRPLFLDALDGNMEGSWERRRANRNDFYTGFKAMEYDSIGLPNHLLAQYYQQKIYNIVDNDNLAEDAYLKCNFEGEGSSAGSVGCCSLLENDGNDLRFLDDLDPKFKTLAELCSGQEIQANITPPPTKVVIPPKTELQKLPPKADLPPILPEADLTVTRASKQSRTTTMENQGQMFLLQQEQPIFYTSAAPVQYVVQPQVQNAVLLAEAPSTQLQSVFLAAPAQGMTVSGGHAEELQNVVMVETQLPVESLKVLKGSQRGRGTSRISGGQRVHLVEGSSSTVKSFNKTSGETRTPGPQVASSRVPTYRKVAVRETRE
ncbi:desmoglein-2.1-like isoform X2 [Corythoichthys intestinalis]|uniref:desmoglein-2.1-like isoform X2 n=1 Tax=Corythoichthys intestinalis TaxID=161448 RepID=UPI0025A5D627|nr:desmoglein-2.1-like isoform X2 [Corythoichthys intestinalis]